MRASLVATLVVLLAGCGEGQFAAELANQPNDPNDPNASCTDPFACCPADKLVCHGDPDKGLVCSCTDLWDCSKDPAKCEQPTPSPGGSMTWTCSWSSSGFTCTATGSQDAPPGGNDWTCAFDDESSTWTCTSSYPPNPDNSPSGATAWSCVVDNETDTLSCEKNTSTTPTNPTPPTPKPGDECVVGQKKWCDGEIYCGWGQTTCVEHNGTARWDWKCVELADGRRPNTTCACYYTYFNEKCCETPDCIVPTGTNGQICDYASGNLCDPCNPQKPSCTEAGAKCVVYADQQFCGKACSSLQACPTDYSCLKGQCVPTSKSCLTSP